MSWPLLSFPGAQARPGVQDFPMHLAHHPALGCHHCAWWAQSRCQAQVSAALRGCRQCEVGPLISGPHSAIVPEARALLSRTEVSSPDLQPHSLLLATESGLCFIQCWLCCDMFWEPLNLSHRAICCYATFPRKCILISKGKERFIWKQLISWRAAAVCVKPAQSPQLEGALTATGPLGLKKPMWPWRPCLCFASLLHPKLWLTEVFCYLSSNKCLLPCNQTWS